MPKSQHQMTVTFVWDEELGEKWMNPDNLGLLLYSQTRTKPDLLRYEVHQEQQEQA